MLSLRYRSVLFGTLLCCTLTGTAAKSAGIDTATPSRIVSIGGAITEIVYALGMGDRLVGIDTTSLYPVTALKEKPNVGYMRQLSAEGVLALNPQLILTIEGSGPKETLDVLKSAGITFVTIPEKFNEDGLIDKIRQVAKVLHVEARGECLAGAVTTDLAALHRVRDSITAPRRIMFVMSFLNGRAMVAGKGTAADEIITLSGGINAIDGFDGYKAINDEAVVAAKPDAILTMERGKETLDQASLYANSAFAMTPAAANKSFLAMDGLYLLGFGPRTAAAARDLAISLYPAVATGASSWKAAALSAHCDQ